jgi:hypothetical protein
MTSVDVHDDIGKVEALKSVSDALFVGTLAVLASLQVGIGDKVGERVRLDDESEGGVGVGLDLRDNSCTLVNSSVSSDQLRGDNLLTINVLRLVAANIAVGEFTV